MQEKSVKIYLILALIGLIAHVILFNRLVVIFYLIGSISHFLIVKQSAKGSTAAVKKGLIGHFSRFTLLLVFIVWAGFFHLEILSSLAISYTFQLLILVLSIKS